jgi:hypothetical protein
METISFFSKMMLDSVQNEKYIRSAGLLSTVNTPIFTVFIINEGFRKIMRQHGSWENRCQRCGRCCYEKIEFEGEIYYTETPCEFLDQGTSLCRVYATRHIDKPDCSPLTPRQVKRGLLPADCPYVKDFPDYKSPQLFEDDDSQS